MDISDVGGDTPDVTGGGGGSFGGGTVIAEVRVVGGEILGASGERVKGGGGGKGCKPERARETAGLLTALSDFCRRRRSFAFGVSLKE